MCDHSLDEAQGLATQDFTKHFADVSQADAVIMKNQRLLRAELRAQTGGVQPVLDSDDKEGQPARRQRKRGAKAKAKPAAKAAG